MAWNKKHVYKREKNTNCLPFNLYYLKQFILTHANEIGKILLEILSK